MPTARTSPFWFGPDISDRLIKSSRAGFRTVLD